MPDSYQFEFDHDEFLARVDQQIADGLQKAYEKRLEDHIRLAVVKPIPLVIGSVS